jgi:hypothetical protein
MSNTQLGKLPLIESVGQWEGANHSLEINTVRFK